MSTKKLRELFLEDQNENVIEHLKFDWPIWARLNQRPPLSNWRTWLLLGGRGAGKTRTGAEWLKGVALADPHYPGSAGGRIALVGADYNAVRDVMIEGESGLLAIHKKQDRPSFIASRRELTWPNGTIGKLFSSVDFEGLRGNQFGAAWCDEICKWRNLEPTWNMLQLCLRLGHFPRQVVTTTPKPLKLLKQLLEDPATVTVRSSTRENASNLADGFLEYVEGIYAGTRIGRQELEGEILEDNEYALWKRSVLEASRVKDTPDLKRIVVAVDPPASSTSSSASCGIVAVGLDENDICYVLADKTIHQVSPAGWAKQVIDLYHLLEADLVVAEVNQGGNMVESILTTADPNIPVRCRYASRGKWVRAEPVALLYEKGKVKHHGIFNELEDQMCLIGPDGKADGVSPDRVDALVWAITELALTRRLEPRIRQA